MTDPLEEPTERSTRARRRFFLEVSPADGPPCLTQDEVRHATTVLRLRQGEAILGLDGRGNAWPLTIQRIERSSLELAATGPVESELPAGAPGAAAPALTVAFSMPGGNRLDALVDRLTQLGVTHIAPFVAAHTPVRSRTLKPRLAERLTRIARAACKQSRRLWEPVVAPLRPLEEILAETDPAPAAVLDPGADRRLSEWCEARSPEVQRQLAVYIGPEGGFSEAELQAFAGSTPPVQPAWLGPHVMRIETAAEAAAALVLHHCTRVPGRTQ